MEWYEKKRGRPKGSKTRAETPGRKRARDYFDQRYDEDKRPTEAASIVSEKFGVEQYQVFKDAKRHEKHIAQELHEENERMRLVLEARQSVMDMGPHVPKSSRIYIAWMFLNALKGHLLK